MVKEHPSKPGRKIIPIPQEDMIDPEKVAEKFIMWLGIHYCEVIKMEILVIIFMIIFAKPIIKDILQGLGIGLSASVIKKILMKDENNKSFFNY